MLSLHFGERYEKAYAFTYETLVRNLRDLPSLKLTTRSEDWPFETEISWFPSIDFQGRAVALESLV